MSKETSRQIEEQAFAWLARKDGGSLSSSEHSELAAWLASDTAHRVALLRLEAAWERTGRLKAFGVGMKRGVVPLPGQWRTSPFFEPRPTPARRFGLDAGASKLVGAAAAVLLVVAGGVAYLSGVFLSGDRYTTQVGVVASIPLHDGSSITLNTASKVRVALSTDERRIELEEGEAFFKVAKDSSRPFVVLAGERRITAIGTAFSVRRSGREVHVVVTEGTVRVDSQEGTASAELLPAGTVLHTTRGSVLVQNKTPQQAEEALTWRTGYLTFDETSLADAVAEFNRYTSQRIVIEDPKLAALRINGKFRSTNAEDFVQLLRTGFGIQVRATEHTINLSTN